MFLPRNGEDEASCCGATLTSDDVRATLRCLIRNVAPAGAARSLRGFPVACALSITHNFTIPRVWGDWHFRLMYQPGNELEGAPTIRHDACVMTGHSPRSGGGVDE